MQKATTKTINVFMLAFFVLSVTGAVSCGLCDAKADTLSPSTSKNSCNVQNISKNSKVVTVAGDGSGKYNCDEKDAQVQINQALAFAAKNPGTIVHLKGPFRYFISDTLLIGSNTILEGEPGVTIKLAPGLNKWGGRGSSIAKEKAMLMIKDNSAKNVTIRNLTVDGSQSDYYPKVKLGAYYYNMATLIGCNGLTIRNVTFQNGCNDAMLISKCSNIVIDGVIVNKCGHDGVYAYNVKNITVKNCKFINRTNSSTRFDTVTNGVFANNDCTTSGGGYAGLELENTVKNIDVYGNYFHHLPAPAVAHVHTKEINVKIYNNKIIMCK
jgi:polygalacturonase